MLNRFIQEAATYVAIVLSGTTGISMTCVGSQVTVNPAPLVSTDADVLVLTTIPNIYSVHTALDTAGFINESIDNRTEEYEDCENKFDSWRKGDINVLVTTNIAFYARFERATALCRDLNLKEKKDRVRVHRTILYDE
jgi:hypothetical protein